MIRARAGRVAESWVAGPRGPLQLGQWGLALTFPKDPPTPPEPPVSRAAGLSQSPYLTLLPLLVSVLTLSARPAPVLPIPRGHQVTVP